MTALRARTEDTGCPTLTRPGNRLSCRCRSHRARHFRLPIRTKKNVCLPGCIWKGESSEAQTEEGELEISNSYSVHHSPVPRQHAGVYTDASGGRSGVIAGGPDYQGAG